jgi:hypothetical protein
MHHFSGSPREEKRIAATTRAAAGNAGLTRYRQEGRKFQAYPGSSFPPRQLEITLS